MTYTLKKEQFKNWNRQQTNEKPIVYIENDDDLYISERSSVASSSDLTQVQNPINKRISTPTISSIVFIPQKPSHTRRYPQYELLENAAPIATQFQLQRKEEKQKKKDFRKAPPAQPDLIPFPESKPPESGENYHPGCYYTVKNPDGHMRHRQINDSHIIPYETLDLSQYAHQPVLITSPIKPQQQQQQQPRKSRYHNAPLTPFHQDKQHLDHLENNSTASTHLISHENHETNYQKQRSSTKQNTPVKDSDHDEHRIQPTKRTITQQHRKPKTENDSIDYRLQSLSNGKLSQDTSSLIITSNSLTNRSKKRSKITDKNSVLSDIDENGKHRHYPQLHHRQNQIQLQNPPSIPSLQIHHHNSHHIRRRPPSGTPLGSNVHVVDVSFQKSSRPSYIQQTREPCHLSIPTSSNQTPHLPPIIRDQHKTRPSRFPTEYYGTLARQTHGRDWQGSMDIPKFDKPDSQTRFYYRYLHDVVDKRLAA